MPQQPRRFQAENIEEAYGQVRDALGEDAVILATRRATSPSIYGRPPRSFVEVLAHAPEPSTALPPLVAVGMAPVLESELAPPFENPLAGSGDVSLEMLARVTAANLDEPVAPPEPQPAPEPVAPAPVADSDLDFIDRDDAVAQELAASAASHGQQRTEFEQLLGELSEVRGIVEQLNVERVNDRIDQSPAPLRWLRQRLREQGLKSPLAARVLAQAADAHVPAASADGLRRTVVRQLATMLPPVPRLGLVRRPAFVALVGPAGAGKTTFAMKLALEIEHAHSLRVVVASTNVERAGAPQQFAAVGAAAGVQTRLCYTPGELQALVAEGIADVVIVDTPGHDGSRRDRMAELHTFIRASRNREVLLVLPATMKTVDLERLARAYAPVDPLGVVLTRCDDTASLGEPFSALVATGLGVAYTTHRESVADGPRPGDNLALARAILTGDWANAPSVASGRAA